LCRMCVIFVFGEIDLRSMTLEYCGAYTVDVLIWDERAV
jgi:hypothetical protein